MHSAGTTNPWLTGQNHFTRLFSNNLVVRITCLSAPHFIGSFIDFLTLIRKSFHWFISFFICRSLLQMSPIKETIFCKRDLLWFVSLFAQSQVFSLISKSFHWKDSCWKDLFITLFASLCTEHDKYIFPTKIFSMQRLMNQRKDFYSEYQRKDFYSASLCIENDE